MSATSNDGSSSIDTQPARRVLAREFEDATHIFKESDGDRAPKFALLPTGLRANRLCVVATLTEVENIGKKSDFYRARVVGPTGTFYVYAGKYQPQPMAQLDALEPPEFVSIIGKPRLYEPDEEDSDPMTQIAPESITVVDKETRNEWVVEAGEDTLDRVAAFGVDDEPDIENANEVYGDDVSAYREAAKNGLVDLAGVELADGSGDKSDE